MKEFAEKLIERLEELKEDSINKNCPVVPISEDCEMEPSCASCFLNASIKIVKQLAEEYNQDSTKNNQGWIPCVEKLPKEAEDVILTFRNSAGTFVQMATYMRRKFYYISDADGNYYEEEFKQPIAWMPLPDPYKPEQKEMPTDHFTERFNRVV